MGCSTISISNQFDFMLKFICHQIWTFDSVLLAVVRRIERLKWLQEDDHGFKSQLIAIQDYFEWTLTSSEDPRNEENRHLLNDSYQIYEHLKSSWHLKDD